MFYNFEYDVFLELISLFPEYNNGCSERALFYN